MYYLRLILFLLFVCFGIGIKAQEKSIYKLEKTQNLSARPLKNINLNLLGDASIISINYEKQYLVGETFILSTKFGLGYNQEFKLCFFGPCSSPPENYLTIPHHFTLNFGNSRSFFEFGLGGTILSGETNQPYILYPIIGYRFLPLQSYQLNFRLYFQPPLPRIGENDIGHPDIAYIPLGLSIGTSF